MVRDLVDDMNFTQLKKIISDYEQLEKDACIGDCLLRETAIKTGINIVTAMNMIAFEAYRKLAHFYLEDNR